jgi:MFS family permease
VFVSRTITAFGALSSEVAVLVQAKQLTGSPLTVGLLGIAELVPLLVFGLYGGALADRFDRRALMRWCEAGLVGGAVLLLVNALLPRPAVWPLFALVAVMVAVSSLQRPSLDASVPRLVERDQLTAAMALLSMSQNANFILGSALGGLLAVTPGPWLVYGLEAAGFAASFVFLSRVPPLPTGGLAGRSAMRDIMTGLRYAIQRRDLSPDLPVALACLIVAGAADMVSGIFRGTLWNQTIPDELRGRLAGVELLSWGVGPPVGQLRSGLAASLSSARFSLVSGGLLCAGAVAVLCAVLPAFVRYQAPLRQPAHEERQAVTGTTDRYE